MGNALWQIECLLPKIQIALLPTFLQYGPGLAGRDLDFCRGAIETTTSQTTSCSTGNSVGDECIAE